jgi:hypothetical protein
MLAERSNDFFLSRAAEGIVSFPKIPSGPIRVLRENQGIIRSDASHAPSAFGTFVANPFTSRRRLEVENLFLRHKLTIALWAASLILCLSA